LVSIAYGFLGNACEACPRSSIPMRYVRPPTVIRAGTFGSSRIALDARMSIRGRSAAAAGAAAPSVSATAATGAARKWRRSDIALFVAAAGESPVRRA
jgi:hypothetical protein